MMLLRQFNNRVALSSCNRPIKKLAAYLGTTLAVYSTMRQRFLQVTKVVSFPTEKEKTAGLYSSVGFIADLEALHEIEDGRKFLEQVSKSNSAFQQL